MEHKDTSDHLLDPNFRRDPAHMVKYETVSMEEMDVYFRYLDFYMSKDLIAKIIKADTVGNPNQILFFLNSAKAYINLSGLMVRDWAVTYLSRIIAEGLTIEIGGGFGNLAGAVVCYNKRVKTYQIFGDPNDKEFQRRFLNEAYPEESERVLIDNQFVSGFNYDSVISLYSLSRMKPEDFIKFKPVLQRAKKGFLMWDNAMEVPAWLHMSHAKTINIVMNPFDGKKSQLITW